MVRAHTEHGRHDCSLLSLRSIDRRRTSLVTVLTERRVRRTSDYNTIIYIGLELRKAAERFFRGRRARAHADGRVRGPHASHNSCLEVCRSVPGERSVPEVCRNGTVSAHFCAVAVSARFDVFRVLPSLQFTRNMHYILYMHMCMY